MTMKNLLSIILLALVMSCSSREYNGITVMSPSDGYVAHVNDVLQISKVGDTLVMSTMIGAGVSRTNIYGFYKGSIPETITTTMKGRNDVETSATTFYSRVIRIK